MKQILINSGAAVPENVPIPKLEKDTVLVKTIYSCISPGTEINGLQDSGKGLIKQVMEDPSKINKAFTKLRNKGIAGTLNIIKKETKKKDKPSGYSLSGIVIDKGEEVTDYDIGDRVTVSGGGIANHAEYVVTPKNLITKIPKNVSFQDASTVTIGAIALQGVRRADLRIGEYCAIIGSGVLGLLTLQILKAAGIYVVVIEPDPKRLKIAEEIGADLILNPNEDSYVEDVVNWTNYHGVDAVIFTAATSSNEPLSKAFQICRKKGKVVLVGISGMEIARKDIYPKELDFLISTSYGPGRYDKNYEEKGVDYPYSYVRWTENRNMQEYLNLIQDKKINLEKIVDEIYPIEQAEKAFESFSKDIRPLLVLLQYASPKIDNSECFKIPTSKVVIKTKKNIGKSIINIGLIGCGNFAQNIHLPNIKKLSNKFNIYAIMDKMGSKGKSVAKEYNANYVTSDFDDIINDKNIDLVMITTRHDSHGQYILAALKADKNVFVEKPLCTTKKELNEIEKFYKNTEDYPLLMVGFNRRFSKYSKEIKNCTKKRINPLFIHYRMNAGYIPLDSWVHENGGRIIGEACHIIDLMTFFTESKIKSISYENLSPKTNYFSSTDNKSIILKYSDGSIATIEYFACGNKKFPKEYMEIHYDEKTITMNDYRSLKSYGINLKNIGTKKSDKGHIEELERLYDSIIGNNSEWPIDFWDIVQTTEITLLISDA
ncbi:MAG: bi-domain-containing oxidoreductase [Candidatus Cloacimonetes bacterium]|nr:bi-domain-containing oxidoreductase [Candidatus Cloacimonadota bacterium]